MQPGHGSTGQTGNPGLKRGVLTVWAGRPVPWGVGSEEVPCSWAQGCTTSYLFITAHYHWRCRRVISVRFHHFKVKIKCSFKKLCTEKQTLRINHEFYSGLKLKYLESDKNILGYLIEKNFHWLSCCSYPKFFSEVHEKDQISTLPSKHTSALEPGAGLRCH